MYEFSIPSTFLKLSVCSFREKKSRVKLYFQKCSFFLFSRSLTSIRNAMKNNVPHTAKKRPIIVGSNRSAKKASDAAAGSICLKEHFSVSLHTINSFAGNDYNLSVF